MYQRFIKALVGAIGFILLIYVSIYFVWEAGKLSNWASSGVIDSEIQTTDDFHWVFTSVDSTDFRGAFIPMEDDTVLTINNIVLDTLNSAEILQRVYEPGEILRIRYLKYGREREVTLVAKAVPTSRAVPFVILQVLRLVIILTFFFVGLWAFNRRSDSAGVRALSLFCFSMAIFILSSIRVLSDRYAIFDIPNADQIRVYLMVFASFIGGLWLNLNLLFPRKSAFLKVLRGWGYLVIYFPQIVLIAFTIFTDITGIDLPTQYFVIATVIQFIAGFYLLSRHFKRARSLLEKRQTRLVLYGSGAGLLVFTLFILLATLLSEWFTALAETSQLMIINVTFMFLLLTPLSLAYALGKYRLLEVEAKLKRGTRHFVVTAALLTFFFLIAYSLGEMLVRNMGITNRTPTLLISMVLAMFIMPAQRWLQELFEKRFNPGRFQLRVMIEDFIQRMGSFPDRDTLYNQLEKRLREAIGTDRIIAVLKNEQSDYIELNGDNTPFKMDSDLIQQLEKTENSVLIDEAMASFRVPFSDQQLMWIRKREVTLVLPLITRMRLIGFLALGKSTRGGDYTPEVIEVLSSLGKQVSMASENLRLLEDNLEKRRLEEQLSLARDIQRGLLPQSIPNTPGLEIAAKCQFSLEVAGDYYDVIALKDGKTVIAVGDVSGKGAGAALIMANLQASLRTAVKVGVDLEELVPEINDLIWQNTPIEQYITFFVGVFDPSDCSFTYVNAGHNPPMLFTNKDTVQDLDAGGLILGVMQGAKYVSGSVKLNDEDRLLLFTDGVSEAMNPQGEEFGEIRIRQLMKQVAKKDSSEAMAILEKEVIRFHGRRAFEDDFTLLMASMKNGTK